MNSKLFTPFPINQVRFKNRILMAPMHLGYAKEGKLTDEMIGFYIKRAQGGAAAVSFSAGVNEDGLLTNMVSLSDDSCMEGLRKLAEALKKYDCRLIVQLFHCGRNDRKGQENQGRLLAPSPLASPIFQQIPQEMTADDIQKVIGDFAKAAKRCKNAGVDGVQISCSAGYLLSEFLSPLTNLRNDQYGGSFENRVKVPLEVIKAVREAVGPNYLVSIRISAFDMLEGGYSLSDMQRFCVMAQETEIDAVDVTGGWHESPVPQITYQLPEGGFAGLAGAIRSVLCVPVIASNRIHSKEIGEKVLSHGYCDLINVGRPMLTDPDYVHKMTSGKPINTCISCNKGCITRVLRGKEAHCVFNPALEKLSYIPKEVKTKKRVLVIGGGPAGVTCAAELARRGFSVTVVEKENRVGGKTNIAARLTGKEKIEKFIPYAESLMRDLKVACQTNTVADAALIEKINPDYVVVATGAKPVSLPIPGLKRTNYIFAQDLLPDKQYLLSKKDTDCFVVTGGGAVGLETALYLAKSIHNSLMPCEFLSVFLPEQLKNQLKDKRKIVVVEKTEKVGQGLGIEKSYLLKELKLLGVEIFKKSFVEEIKGNSVTVHTENGLITFDRAVLVLSAGYKPCGQEFLDCLTKSGLPFCVIGDAKQVGTLEEAFNDGFTEAGKII